MEQENSDFGKLDESNKSIKTGFDALEIASTVHETTKTLTRDIIIARTELPLEQWGRNQILFTEDMVDLLEGHKKKAKEWKDFKGEKEIKQEQEDLKLRYLGELQLLHGYTRSRSGITHDALIKTPKEDKSELTDLKDKVELLSRLNSKPVNDEGEV